MIDPKAIVAVQYTATQIDGGGVEVCSHTAPYRTHYSLYLRHAEGTVEFINDFKPERFHDGAVSAMKLSMEHGVPIEQMDGLDLQVLRRRDMV